jgi:hypothetical protein
MNLHKNHLTCHVNILSWNAFSIILTYLHSTIGICTVYVRDIWLMIYLIYYLYILIIFGHCKIEWGQSHLTCLHSHLYGVCHKGQKCVHVKCIGLL